MADSARSIGHGVSVVPSDFKDNLEKVSAYIPERKKLSGYEGVPSYRAPVDDQENWRDVIRDWHHGSVDSSSIGSRQRSGSTSTGMSEADLEREDKPVMVVEKLSPALLEAWKQSQHQQLIDSRDKTVYEGTTTSSPAVSQTDPIDQYVRNTASVDSFCSERNPSSVASDPLEFSVSVSDSAPLPVNDHFVSFPPAPIQLPPPGQMAHSDSPPNLLGQNSSLYSTPSSGVFNPIMPPFIPPLSAARTIAPIGTPASQTYTSHHNSPRFSNYNNNAPWNSSGQEVFMF